MAARRRRSRFRDTIDDLDEDEPPQGGAEVDLHGCTVEAATRRVSQALARCRASGRSPLLVITGRGHGSFGGNGVLGPEVKRWLKTGEAKSLGATETRVVRGGGALEVTVRRSDRP